MKGLVWSEFGDVTRLPAPRARAGKASRPRPGKIARPAPTCLPGKHTVIADAHEDRNRRSVL
ncbi:MAG: hypothetical protein ABW187_02660, partial [Dokdonella sp.]